MAEKTSKRFGEVVFEGEKTQVGDSILFCDVYSTNGKFKIQASRINITADGEVFAKLGRMTYAESGIILEGLTAARKYIDAEKAKAAKAKPVVKKGAATKVGKKVEDPDQE